MPTLHQTFTPVTIHTAKCDICNQHNRSVLFRCTDCGWHVCTPCWTEKGGDGTHVMNEGARGWRGAGLSRGSENARSGGDRWGQGERGGLGAGGRGRVGKREMEREREREKGRDRDRGRRQRTDGAAETETARDTHQAPISVAAAADLLIQAASRASPSPSPSPSPRPPSSSSSSFQRPATDASASYSATTCPSASVRATTTTAMTTSASASAGGSRPSDSASAAASRREKMNISRLLRAAETIDRSSPLAPPPTSLPLRASRDKRRAASPLFVEYGSVEVEEEVVLEDSDLDYDDGDGDDEMTGIETGIGRRMTPEPRSPNEDVGDEMRDAWPGRGFQISDVEPEVVGGLSRVPEPAPVRVADGGEVLLPKEGRRDKDGVRGRAGKDDAGAKVPVARRLRELYRSAVLVKDRKGRMRRVGGGLVGRREWL